MVIRRIREHVATHNWFAVGIDLLIVIVGVFLGTQVSNWNQARIEAEQGREYRQRLIGELDFNRRQFAQQQRYYRQVLDHGLRAIAALDSGESVNSSDFLVNAYQLSQIDPTSPKTFIYDEMVSSGLVSRIGGEELQETASDYYVNIVTNDRLMREVLPYRTTIRQLMPFAIQSTIRDRCGDRMVYDNKRLVGVALATKCNATIAPAAAQQAARRIAAHPGLRDEMTRYVASIDEKLDVLAFNMVMTNRFISDLSARSGSAA
ncbi:MAG TPA: hypothetical protein VNJ05_01500 [Sphingomicrobium sp.]|nr:hypothetical protein [Sphingomicrobium sp.]